LINPDHVYEQRPVSLNNPDDLENDRWSRVNESRNGLLCRGRLAADETAFRPPDVFAERRVILPELPGMARFAGLMIRVRNRLRDRLFRLV
jgi:hypothetical protein